MMLLNSVILVLREVLEAAFIVSLLLALSQGLRQGARWFAWTLPPAAMGTALFAAILDRLTEALDGAGQEVTNAAIQVLVYLFVAAIVAMAARVEARPHWRLLQGLMAGAVTLSLVREGAEIVIYITGFAADPAQRAAVFAGSALGAGIGVSVGILLYCALRAMDPTRALALCLLLLGVIATGMLMQASMLLEQVDWLPSATAVWDSSGLVSERSIAGELLYAVFGYEATPSALQLALYLSGLAVMALAWLAPRRLNSA